MFTPGQYHLASPIVVSRPGAVVMGLGFATLVPERGTSAMTVMPNVGVRLSGLISTPAQPIRLSCSRWGHLRPGPGAADDPDLVQDTFFRVGGEAVGSATVSFVDNADYSIIDNVWAWRADQCQYPRRYRLDGQPGQHRVGRQWQLRKCLWTFSVQHYQKYEVIWRGQDGTEVSSRTRCRTTLPTSPTGWRTPRRTVFRRSWSRPT